MLLESDVSCLPAPQCTYTSSHGQGLSRIPPKKTQGGKDHHWGLLAECLRLVNTVPWRPHQEHRQEHFPGSAFHILRDLHMAWVAQALFTKLEEGSVDCSLGSVFLTPAKHAPERIREKILTS